LVHLFWKYKACGECCSVDEKIVYKFTNSLGQKLDKKCLVFALLNLI